MTTTIAVTGGRDYPDKQRVYDALDAASKYYGDNVFLAIGDATGADRHAWEWAIDRKVPYRRFHAEWDKYGKMAGPIRNRDMLNSGVDVLVAFPGGRGTAGCIKEAERRMIPVRIFK